MNLIKNILLFTCAIVFNSCRVYHMYDGASKAVSFLADSTVFDESTGFGKPMLYYSDLRHLNGPFASYFELIPNKNVEAIIAQPTLFSGGKGNFLIFPGDKLTVSKNAEGSYEMKSIDDVTRTRELQLLNKFEEIAPAAYATQIHNLSYREFAIAEEEIKNRKEWITRNAKLLFDSLQTVYNTSKKFREETKDYVTNRYSFFLVPLYKEYKDSLLDRGIYQAKFIELLPAVNKISSVSEIEYCTVSLNEIANELLPYKIERIKTKAEFEADYDKLFSLTTGLAREYLLSTLIYAAHSKKIDIASSYLDTYRAVSVAGPYQKIINNILRGSPASEMIYPGKDNPLFTLKANEIKTLDELLSNNRGKIIFLDFMASWCVPCREDLPLLNKLKEGYSKTDIVFLNLSLDKQYQSWKKFILSAGLEKEYSFMFVDVYQSSFVNKYKIETIPRYLIFDQTGKLVDGDAPRPQNERLKLEIDSLLAKPK